MTTTHTTTERKLPHFWVEAPPALGCKKICRVCGAKDVSKEAQDLCEGELVPRQDNTFNDYDPYE